MADLTNFAAACNTIKAHWFTLLLARIFGQKVCTFDDWAGERTIITGYRFRGVLYLTNITRVPTHRKS